MAQKPKSDPKPAVLSPAAAFDFNPLALSGEIGLNLAIPLLVFMIIGIKLDRAVHTAPLFTLLGIALAMTSSVVLIARMIARVNGLGKANR